MRIIEINALPNGAHRNQNGGATVVPSGWAVIPDNIVVPDTFPFVDIEVKDGLVVSMTAGVMPEPEPEPEAEPTTEELVNLMLGVNRYE